MSRLAQSLTDSSGQLPSYIPAAPLPSSLVGKSKRTGRSQRDRRASSRHQQCDAVASKADGEACEQLDVVVAHSNSKTLDYLQQVLGGLGHAVRHQATSAEELLHACVARPPEIIVTGIEFGDGSAIESLLRISDIRPTPAVVVTPKTSLRDVEQALRDHVMAYLVEPVDAAQIKPTIHLVCQRFREFEALRTENQDLKQALADRRVIERAKGLLMGQFALSEPDAFRQLQRLSQTRRTKMVAIAETILASAEQNASSD
jgi:response regulator NasT